MPEKSFTDLTFSELKKCRPNREDIYQFLGELEKQPDRSLAILGATTLEIVLADLIQSHLTDQLEGILENHYKNINLGFAFGIISRKIFDDLNIIRNLRNVFAHGHYNIDFQHQAIALECSKISIVNEEICMAEMTGDGPWYDAPAFDDMKNSIIILGKDGYIVSRAQLLKDDSARSRFSNSIQLLNMILIDRRKPKAAS